MAGAPPPMGDKIPASKEVFFHMTRTPPDRIPLVLLFVPFLFPMESYVYSLTEKSQFSVMSMHLFEMRVMPERVNMGLSARPHELKL